MTDNKTTPEFETAILGGGCFWCLEAVFDLVDGVEEVVPGYCGGHVEDPSYRQVCSGGTGHAEVIKIVFDPARVSYRELLEIFFTIHDPTTLNRQGNDIGTQYRSGIYWHDERQLPVIEAVRGEVDRASGGRVVTEVQPLSRYGRAEDEHQVYFERHPHQGYCAFVVAPKVEHFRRHFAGRLRR